MRCLSCKYDLRKLAEHRCPECGRAFDPDDPTTFRTQSLVTRKLVVRWIVIALLSYAVSYAMGYRYLVIYNELVTAQWSSSKMLKDSLLFSIRFLPLTFCAVVAIYFFVAFCWSNLHKRTRHHL